MTHQHNFNDLVELMNKLLSEDGCPWDKEQTHESLKPYLIEECYEVADAIDQKDMKGLAEELGDVLLSVVFHACLAEKEKNFTIDDVICNLSDKLVRRHPHIFNTYEIKTSAEVLDNWDEIKKTEKNIMSDKENMLAVPKAMPALMRAYKVVKRSGLNNVFYLDNVNSLCDLIHYLSENNGANENLESIYGELLLQIVRLGHFLQVNPEFALTNAIETFINNVCSVKACESKDCRKNIII